MKRVLDQTSVCLVSAVSVLSAAEVAADVAVRNTSWLAKQLLTPSLHPSSRESGRFLCSQTLVTMAAVDLVGELTLWSVWDMTARMRWGGVRDEGCPPYS